MKVWWDLATIYALRSQWHIGENPVLRSSMDESFLAVIISLTYRVLDAIWNSCFYTLYLSKLIVMKRYNLNFSSYFLKYWRSGENLLACWHIAAFCGHRLVSDFPVCSFLKNCSFPLRLSCETVGFGLCSSICKYLLLDPVIIITVNINAF